ncbi:MAG: type II toxin-antitoxin system RelE/ParE family toxin [Ardenticatenaceae bacterium]|nr:type II toxin-antitoxin system RelE/ParE family toxin [Ardenticatenaceae bacterium]
MDLPGFRLHPLKGDKQGLWAIDVNKNWRITFEFIDGTSPVQNVGTVAGKLAGDAE